MTLPDKLSILGVMISRTNYEAVVEKVILCAKRKECLAVTALAVHGIMEGFIDESFRKGLNEIHIVTPDGQPVRWSLNLLGAKEVKERVYGPALMIKICEKAANGKLSIFLYGSKIEVLEKLQTNLLSKYPHLIIAGKQADRFREASPEEEGIDIAAIKNSKADIVFVGRGCPRQEKWIVNKIGKLDCPMIAVGAAFDFHAGTLKQAPQFFQQWGLEWLFRLIQEPKRLWRRYLLYNPRFMFHLSLQLLGKKY